MSALVMVWAVVIVVLSVMYLVEHGGEAQTVAVSGTGEIEVAAPELA